MTPRSVALTVQCAACPRVELAKGRCPFCVRCCRKRGHCGGRSKPLVLPAPRAGAGLEGAVSGALVVACPQCASPAAERGSLAAHLVEAHGRNGLAALQEARRAFGSARIEPSPTTAPAGATEPTMPKTGKRKCSKCGTPGHRANTCGRAAVTPSEPMRVRGKAQTPTGAVTAIRAEIAATTRKLGALKSALACLEE